MAVIAAVVATWQQLDADRRRLRAQLAMAGQEQAAARFARAVDQLASDRLDVRLGGIYGLERVATSGSGSGPGGGAYRLAGARVNAATRWPSGFDWRTAGARLVQVCQA